MEWILPEDVAFMGEGRKKEHRDLLQFTYLGIARPNWSFVCPHWKSNERNSLFLPFPVSNFMFLDWVNTRRSACYTNRGIFLTRGTLHYCIQTIFRHFALIYICFFILSLASKTIILSFPSHYTPWNYRLAKQIFIGTRLDVPKAIHYFNTRKWQLWIISYFSLKFSGDKAMKTGDPYSWKYFCTQLLLSLSTSLSN